MRWYVEISPAGKEDAPTHKLCLEAPHWQPALQQARRILGQDDKLSGVSVEFLDDGFSQAPLTNGHDWAERVSPTT